MYTGATVTDCADSVIAASPSPRPTYQIPRRALTFNFCCSTSPPTNCESFINLFFATSDSHLMPDLLDPSWSNCFQANPWSDEMLGIVLWPAMSSWAKKIFWSKNDFQCETLSFKAQYVFIFSLRVCLCKIKGNARMRGLTLRRDVQLGRWDALAKWWADVWHK